MSREAETGRVALVTGAARGIGAATVRALCDRGYNVVAVDCCAGTSTNDLPGVGYALADKDALEALRAEHPDQVVALVTDVRDRAALDRAAVTALDRFGRLDAAVAAAGVIAGGLAMWETPPSHVRTLWDVDVMGVWNTAAVTVPRMLGGPDPGGCRFVAVASAAGYRGLFHLAGYGMTKHAVIGLVRGLAADLTGTGVSAVAVSPGSTDTAMLSATAALYGLDDAEAFASSQQLGRLIQPAEVAEVIAFCCSRAGEIMTGSVISAEGGFRG